MKKYVKIFLVLFVFFMPCVIFYKSSALAQAREAVDIKKILDDIEKNKNSKDAAGDLSPDVKETVENVSSAEVKSAGEEVSFEAGEDKKNTNDPDLVKPAGETKTSFEEEKPAQALLPQAQEAEDKIKEVKEKEPPLSGPRIKMTLGYMSVSSSSQVFEVVDSQDRKISRLDFPIKGNMYTVSGDLRLTRRFLLGGSFASSNLRQADATDSDWLPDVSSATWWQSRSDCRSEIKFYDANIYYRLFGSKDEEKTGNNIRIAWIDIFGGWQKQRGVYKISGLENVVENWVSVSNPVGGLDSFYEIEYSGPQAGVRLLGVVTENFFFNMSFTRGSLDTSAQGFWNLRDYTFSQKGEGAVYLNTSISFSLRLTQNILAGLGWHFMSWKQGALKESATESGNSYQDMDIIRNADCNIEGISAGVTFTY